MRILAIDVGLKTGWAMYIDGNIYFGTWDLKGNRFEGAGMRFIRLVSYLEEMLPLDRIAYEEVRGHIGTDAAHCYGGMISHIQTFCEHKQIPYEGIPVGTIKKFATGKGNANKGMMINSIKSMGFPVQDDNQADAVAMILRVMEVANGKKTRKHNGKTVQGSQRNQ